MGWSLTESSVHDACRLGVLETGLLLLERWLLLETGRLRSKRVAKTGRSRLERLARWVGEG